MIADCKFISPILDINISQTLFTRSIGVGGIGITDAIYMERGRREEPASPTGSISGSLRRRVRTFDVGVQINECELQDEESAPLLQIIEKIDVGVQTVLEEPAEKKRFKDAGSLAKTLTYDVGVAAKVRLHRIFESRSCVTKYVYLISPMCTMQCAE